MKWIRILTSLVPGLVATFTYAEPVYFDQSKNIVFEQFAQNSFSLQLLQNKNTFNTEDIVLGGLGQFDWQHWQGDKFFITPPPPPTYQLGTQLYFTQATFYVMSNLKTVSYTHLTLPTKA